MTRQNNTALEDKCKLLLQQFKSELLTKPLEERVRFFRDVFNIEIRNGQAIALTDTSLEKRQDAPRP